MVRPFDLRDLALVRRLSERGVALHALSALADNLHPLRSALLSMLPGGEFPTFVCKADNGDGSGYVQLRVHGSSPHAHVLYISPADDLGCDETAEVARQDSLAAQESIWLALLDEAVAGAGARGIHHVVAEIDEFGAGLTILRRAGFAVYTRQDIWTAGRADYRPRQKANCPALEPRGTGDDWDIQLLYANTVPRLVQLVEPQPPLDEGETWVMRFDAEVGAVVHIHRGDLATWIRFFIHPDAEADADTIIGKALEIAFEHDTERVYCCVRRYESWPAVALERRGLSVVGSHAVMVRHTVHQASRPQAETVKRVDSQAVTASSRFIRQFDQPETDDTPTKSRTTTGHG